MLFPILALIVSIVVLIWSADRFVSGAAATASNLGLSKLIIGLTIVSIGTSAPEILVGLQASWSGAPAIAIGNAIGSNIANMGLVLGITAMIRPLPFAPSVLKVELPWLMGATVIGLVCLVNNFVGRGDAVLLLAGLTYVMVRLVRAGRVDQLPENITEEIEDLPEMSTVKGFLWFLVGLVGLLVSAHVIVQSAVEIAHQQQVDEIIIGLTIIAIGTSLPELAATMGAAIKGHTEIAIGNVVGSNILNILAVMAVPALFHPIAIEAVVLWRDYGMMLAMTIFLALCAYAIGSQKVITRFEAGVMVAGWIGYNYMLYVQA